MALVDAQAEGAENSQEKDEKGSDWAGVGSVLGPLGTIGGAIYGGIKDEEATLYNRDIAKRDFNYNRDVQKIQWRREDTAYRRKVADMRAAGLNPILAAGGGGSESRTFQVNQQLGPTPQPSDSARLALAAITDSLNITRTMEEIKSIRLQQERIAADRLNVMEDVRRKRHDNKIYEDSGVASNSSSWGKQLADLIGVYQQNSRPIGEQVKEKVRQMRMKTYNEVTGEWMPGDWERTGKYDPYTGHDYQKVNKKK